MALHDELKCFGLLGFGAGYAFGKENAKPDQVKTLPTSENYCASKCKVNEACLLRHRTKCQLMFPRATKAFDALCKSLGQAKATQAWQTRNPGAPIEPYMVQMVANLQDGFEWATHGQVCDRGRQTLKYPRSDA